MQKIFIEFRFMINEKEYRISCEPNSPFDDCEKLIELFKNDLKVIKDSQIAQVQSEKKEETQQQEALDGQ